MGEKVDGRSGGLDTLSEQLRDRDESGPSQWVKEVRELHYNTHCLNCTSELV